MSKLALFLQISLLIVTTTWAKADDDIPQDVVKHPKLFDGIWKNTTDSFTGSRLLLHGAAIGSTFIFVNTGVDAKVYDTFRHSENEASWPGAILASGAGAAAAGLWLYFNGKSDDNPKTVGAAFVIAQASLITGVYIKALKMITGRAHPSNTSHLSPLEQSQSHNIGELHLTSGYGWPSGHMSHTVAVMSALSHYYPEKNWIKWVGYGLSGYMLYTISSHTASQMHWFSDGVAGAFFGYAIGSTVGRNFRIHVDGAPSESPNVSWHPQLGPNYYGLVAIYKF